MKKLLISMLLAITLMSVMAMPAMAADTQSVGGSVTVNEVVSITLTDAGVAGINFGTVTPPVTEQGDVAQLSGTPAIKVVVAAETNVAVDISIMGTTASSLPLSNWKYSKDFIKTGIASLTGTYVAVYTSAVAGSSNDFYHWITVPSGTVSGSHTATVSYKAAKHV